MKDRILHFLSLEKLTPTRFADFIGVQRSGVSHILAGRNKPSFDFIEKMLLAFPNLNAEWLVLGKGEIYKGSSSVAATTQLPSLFDSIPDISEPVLPAEQHSKVEKAEKPQPTAATPPQPSKTVESIAIFYSDKTFSVYSPE